MTELEKNNLEKYKNAQIVNTIALFIITIIGFIISLVTKSRLAFIISSIVLILSIIDWYDMVKLIKRIKYWTSQ